MDEPANRVEEDPNVSEAKGQKRTEPPKYF